MQRREFVDADLRGAHFVRADLSGAVLRAVDVEGAEIDAPWLFDGDGHLLVNGVDVVPFVDAELDDRFPGRAQRHATDPEGLCAAWAALEDAWSATLKRAAAMPPESVEVLVGGEWSFAQTLRHLVMATDTWLGRAVRGLDQPFHRIGQPNVEYAADGNDTSIFQAGPSSYAEVLQVRASRVAMVREFLATIIEDELTQARKNPWSPQHPETVLSCLHTIFDEEWEHHRYAVRDLDAMKAGSGARSQQP